MAGELLDEDPEAAWAHAEAARAVAGRIGVVREAAGLAAYCSGRFDVALAELRTARRLTGSSVHLPVIADCERGLGRPERALTLATSSEAGALDRAGQVEMLIVASGARADLGQLEAAVITLQVPQLTEEAREPWLARLRAAYAGALAAVGRVEESRHWLELAAEVDDEGVSGADDLLAELDGVTFLDVAEVGEIAVASDAVPGLAPDAMSEVFLDADREIAAGHENVGGADLSGPAGTSADGMDHPVTDGHV